jgi:multiple sugar transport system permease protein
MTTAATTATAPPITAHRTPRPRRPSMSVATRVLFVIALTFFAVLFLFPLLWLVFAALKPNAEVFSLRPIGSEVRWSNYTTLFDMAPVLRWTWNSVLVTGLAATAVTISSAMIAFAFSYFRFPGRQALFYSVLATMMLPSAVTFIPQFLIWDRLGFTDTLYPLWAPNLFGSAFYIFMLRQFFLTLPRDLFEAARIDGASYPRLWWSIAMPLVKPALIVVFVLELKVAWTDLIRPLIFLRSVNNFTLARGLKAIVDNPAIGLSKRWDLLAAGGVLVTLPMILIFAVFQRYFTQGIATTGIK